MAEMDLVATRRTYRYGADALVPFGAGQSYTVFHLSFADEADGRVATMDAANVSAKTVLVVEVKNVGEVRGDEVVQLFLWPKEVPLLARHPIKNLVGFVRLHDISAGASQDATFELTRDALLLATEEGDLASVPGKYELTAENGAGAMLTKELAITGKERVVVVPFPAVGL
eukprot:SAG31_NODE_7113_length_1785_cov_1.273428_2_plen_171_part_00